jgi:UDP-N-acetylglucosamine 2-epimerase
VIGCEIYITDSKDLFKSLYQNKAKIEEELQEQLEWLELPNKKASRIKITRKGNINNKSKWENYFEWLLNVVEKFRQVFIKYQLSNTIITQSFLSK